MSDTTCICPWCGVGGDAVISEQQISCTIGENEFETVSVWKCRACDFWISWDGSDIEELMQHLEAERQDGLFPTNRLTGQEIRELRKRHGLTQEQLARLTGFGRASIERWERGTIVQNESADAFLRLIDDADVMQKLLKLRGWRLGNV